MKSRIDILVSSLCSEIDYLEQQLEESKEREKYWRDQFNGMLDDSLKHNQELMGNTLKMLLTPGVSETFIANANAEDFAPQGDKN